MASAKMASAIDVRIDDVGSILKSFASPCGFSGVGTEFPYRVRIVDRGVIAATLFAATISDPQRWGRVLRVIT